MIEGVQAGRPHIARPARNKLKNQCLCDSGTPCGPVWQWCLSGGIFLEEVLPSHGSYKQLMHKTISVTAGVVVQQVKVGLVPITFVYLNVASSLQCCRMSLVDVRTPNRAISLYAPKFFSAAPKHLQLSHIMACCAGNITLMT